MSGKDVTSVKTVLLALSPLSDRTCARTVSIAARSSAPEQSLGGLNAVEALQMYVDSVSDGRDKLASGGAARVRAHRYRDISQQHCAYRQVEKC